MLLYLTRHGQTEWNVETRLQGCKDSNLTENGISQAKELSSMLENENIDIIVSSPLKRATDTVDLIKGDRNIPIIYDERLKEISAGEVEGLLFEDAKNKYPYEFVNIRKYPFTVPYPDGESLSELYNRSIDCIKHLINKFIEKNVLIVTHGSIVECLLTYLKKGEMKVWNDEEIKNCQIFLFEINGDSIKQRQLNYAEKN